MLSEGAAVKDSVSKEELKSYGLGTATLIITFVGPLSGGGKEGFAFMFGLS